MITTLPHDFLIIWVINFNRPSNWHKPFSCERGDYKYHWFNRGFSFWVYSILLNPNQMSSIMNPCTHGFILLWISLHKICLSITWVDYFWFIRQIYQLRIRWLMLFCSVKGCEYLIFSFNPLLNDIWIYI